MAAPQGGYPPQEGYGQPQPNPYDQQNPGSPVQANVPGADPAGGAAAGHGGKKKRAYAGQAYDFGTGANSALGGQQQAGGAYGGYPVPAQPQGYPQAAYGVDQTQTAAPGYPQPNAPQVAGYQAPTAGYPAPPAPGVQQMTQQFGQMGVSDPSQMQAQPPMTRNQLNQLYPTDLLTQPFNVAELDFPPPPIVLPSNVSITLVDHQLQILTCLDQRYPFSVCELPSEIRPFYPECCPYHTFSLEEVSPAVWSCYSTIYITT